MVSSTHHLDFVGKSTAIWLISSKNQNVPTVTSTKSSILDPTPVEGQHTELLMHNQGIYLL